MQFIFTPPEGARVSSILTHTPGLDAGPCLTTWLKAMHGKAQLVKCSHTGTQVLCFNVKPVKSINYQTIASNIICPR